MREISKMKIDFDADIIVKHMSSYDIGRLFQTMHDRTIKRKRTEAEQKWMDKMAHEHAERCRILEENGKCN